jgi:indolepyruvate ferredoxin oxidoreductase beta subunit
LRFVGKKEKNMKENFNLVIVGVGGQGQITLLRILQEAALIEKKDFKGSELHGLSQRGGSVEVHFRMGKNVFSPLISQGDADLILALEMQESLRSLYYASSKTQFLINDLIIPIPREKVIEGEEILNCLKIFTQKIKIVKATQICKQNFGKEILAGVYLLGISLKESFLPLKFSSLEKSLKKIIQKEYLTENLKALYLGFEKKF